MALLEYDFPDDQRLDRPGRHVAGAAAAGRGQGGRSGRHKGIASRCPGADPRHASPLRLVGLTATASRSRLSAHPGRRGVTTEELLIKLMFYSISTAGIFLLSTHCV